jgi:hypothetical protein
MNPLECQWLTFILDGLGINPNDNFIVPTYSSGRNNNNSGNVNGPIDPLGPYNQGGGFIGLPPDEYSAMSIYRSLNYSRPMEAYTGKQLTDLQTSTILRFTYEYSDYVADMLPIHNYMSKKAKHKLVHSMLARQ